jgi:hypothetical protein
MSEQTNVGMDGDSRGQLQKRLFRSRLVAYPSELVLACVEQGIRELSTPFVEIFKFRDS